MTLHDRRTKFKANVSEMKTLYSSKRIRRERECMKLNHGVNPQAHASCLHPLICATRSLSESLNCVHVDTCFPSPPLPPPPALPPTEPRLLAPTDPPRGLVVTSVVPAMLARRPRGPPTPLAAAASVAPPPAAAPPVEDASPPSPVSKVMRPRTKSRKLPESNSNPSPYNLSRFFSRKPSEEYL